MKSIFVSFCSIFLASILGVSYGQANQTCIHTGLVTPVHNFSPEKILGSWYAYSFYRGLKADVKPLNFRCLKEEFVVSTSETFPIIAHESYIDISSGEDVPKNASDYVSISDKNPAIWKIITFADDDVIIETDIVFVQTDYSNWAIQYGCSVRDNYRYETMSIVTRSKTPDPEVMALLEILVKNYGFPLENAMPVDQTNC